MAKATKEKEKELKVINDLEGQIVKQYGDVMVSAKNLESTEGEIIPCTLSMDLGSGGGWIEGSIANISGAPGHGKTTLALQIMANALSQDKTRTGYFVDMENKLMHGLLLCINGLDLNRLKIIRSSKEALLSAEKALNIIINIFRQSPGAFVILDSVAALSPEDTINAELGESKRMAGVPTLMYQFLRDVSQIIRPTKGNLILLTHVQSNPSGYGKNTTEVGGYAIRYFPATKLNCISSKEFPDEMPKQGRITVVRVEKNALGGPGFDFNLPIIYGKGYSKVLDIVNTAEEYGILNKAGAWYNFIGIDGVEDKFQGRNNVLEFLEANPDKTQIIENKLRSMVLGNV